MIAEILAMSDSTQAAIVVGVLVFLGGTLQVAMQTRTNRKIEMAKLDSDKKIGKQFADAAATQTVEHGMVRDAVESAVMLLTSQNALIVERLTHQGVKLDAYGGLLDDHGVIIGQLAVTVTTDAGKIADITSEITSIKLKLAENTEITLNNAILTTHNASLIEHNTDLIEGDTPHT